MELYPRETVTFITVASLLCGRNIDGIKLGRGLSLHVSKYEMGMGLTSAELCKEAYIYPATRQYTCGKAHRHQIPTLATMIQYPWGSRGLLLDIVTSLHALRYGVIAGLLQLSLHHTQRAFSEQAFFVHIAFNRR